MINPELVYQLKAEMYKNLKLWKEANARAENLELANKLMHKALEAHSMYLCSVILLAQGKL